MNIKNISDFIVNLEKAVPVNEIKYRKIHLWPIIRGYIYGSLLFDDQNQKPSTPEKKDGTWLSRFKSKIFHQKIAIKEVKKQHFEVEADFLFWSRTIDHSDKVDGLPYSRHTDPYFELFNEQFKCRKLEIGPKIKRKVKTTFLPNWITMVPDHNEIRLDHISKKTLNLINNEFSEYSSKEIPCSFLSSKILKILNLSRIFKEVLKKISPNAVFIVCYHDENTFAVILACNELNIPTIEVQHGQQGIYNSLYCQWTNMPKEGYSLLPNYCWMWGEKSKENFLAGRNDNQTNPIPIVGGNRWLFKKISQEVDLIEDSFIQRLKECQVVTIATQPFSNIDLLIPDFVYNVINKFPLGIQWLVRLHPNQLIQTDEIISFIKQKIDNRNILVQEISNYALYDILEVTNFLITQWSSVIYECQLFNNIPIVVSETGKELFSKKIEDGYFLYAKDESSLTEILETEHNLPVDAEPYIKHDDRTARIAMNRLVEFTN